MSELEFAYNQYRELGFKLVPTIKNKKHAFQKGNYPTMENVEFDPKATGYAGIIPPNLIIVDADTYEDGCEWDRFVSDLGYTPTPFAKTPSGGTHYAFRNEQPDDVVGSKHGYDKLDIYGGYQSVIPIVGTRVLNKQGILADYEWYDEIDGFVVNDWDYRFPEILKMRDRKVGQGGGFEESGLGLARKEFDMPTTEVRELIQEIPDDFEWDDWLKVGIALYERFEGNDTGLEIFQEFGARCTRISDKTGEIANDADTTKDKWNKGHFKSDGRITYKTLRSLAREGNYSNFTEKIKTAKTSKELEAVTKEISEQKFHNTTSSLTETVLDEYAELMNSKYKELKKEKPDTKVLQARTLRKEFEYKMSVEEAEELTAKHGEIQVYIKGSKYLLRIGNDLSEELTKTAVSENGVGKKIPKEVMKPYLDKLITISDVVKVPDYTINEPIEFTLDKSPALGVFDVLTMRTDPLHDATTYIEDEDIIHDFFNNIWNGKAEDIMRLVGLTIRFKETKLNKIMLVAPSDTGKTTLCEHVDFQKINMPNLVRGLNGEKGIGASVIVGIKKSGLLLIDEANGALPSNIKDIDNYMYVDQFGMGGGTQKLKLHYTILTSTHSTGTRTMSDELMNRMLKVELTEEEVQYTYTQSPLQLADSDKYSRVVQSYCRWLVKDTLDNPKYTKKDLKDLQAKYRLETTTDTDDMLYDVSERVVANLRSQASEHGEVLKWHDGYYIKRKKDLVGMVEDMLGENSQLDVGKYAEKLINHFMPNKSRKSIKIGGVPMNYYAINLKNYNPNADPIDVLRESYVNLDLEEF